MYRTLLSRRSPLFVAASLMLVGLPAYAQNPDFETLASELARLRTEVETLSADIEDNKRDTQDRVRTLATQKATLEADIQREELRLKQLNQAMEQIQTRIRDAGAMQRELKPAVLEAIAAVKKPIQDGLPFRVDARLKDLDKLAKDVEDDVVAPTTAVSRLWSRVEDELRLGRENGMYRQIIDVDGEEVLADVARVGMVMMYFRTEDERYGFAAKNGNSWSYELYQTPEDKQRTETLFASLEKRVRVGFFELPNALPKEVK